MSAHMRVCVRVCTDFVQNDHSLVALFTIFTRNYVCSLLFANQDRRSAVVLFIAISIATLIW